MLTNSDFVCVKNHFLKFRNSSLSLTSTAPNFFSKLAFFGLVFSSLSSSRLHGPGTINQTRQVTLSAQKHSLSSRNT